MGVPTKVIAVTWAAAVLAALVLFGCRTSQTPETYLWAWQRAEDLRFLAGSSRIGVAFLAATVTLRDSRAEVERRVQPLLLPTPRPRLVAVTRVEARGESPLTGGQRAQLRNAVLETAGLPDVEGIQIDFDARESQREFYAALIREVRAALPAGRTLSITALASWCLGDNWIGGLPIDDAVPMLFRMSVDGAPIRAQLARGADFSDPLCRNSIGLSTDEALLPSLPGGHRRLFLFSPSAWKAEQVNATLKLLHRLP